MDIKKLEKLEKLDPTAGTLALKNRWKKLVNLNDYRMTNGVCKNYNLSMQANLEKNGTTEPRKPRGKNKK